MTAYREALDYLYAHLPMFQRIGPAAYKKDLGNTLALCDYLGNPHLRFPSIHVGGTNGKGSVSHFLATLCQMSGLKTGLYISPHYRDFRERIKINGQYIPRKRVVEFVRAHREKIEEIQPSFFELCVAMAFDHFARERVDIAVIEVGLGGRLDSTNVITPLLSVITNISYDHQNLLGDTLTLIAGEKAGIIKPGVPVVIGETHPESAPVFLKKAAETRSPIVFADQHYRVEEKENDSRGNTRYDVFRDGKLFLENLGVDVGGPFQQKNLATTLQAWEVVLPLLPSTPPPAFASRSTQNSKLHTQNCRTYPFHGPLAGDRAKPDRAVRQRAQRSGPAADPGAPGGDVVSANPLRAGFCERQVGGTRAGAFSARCALLFCQSRYSSRIGGNFAARKSSNRRSARARLHLSKKCPACRPPGSNARRFGRGDGQYFCSGGSGVMYKLRIWIYE